MMDKSILIPKEMLVVYSWFVLSLFVFFSGHLYSNDTVSKVESARNFIQNGSFSVSGYHGAWGIPVPGDTTYPHFSLGSILIMIPPVALYEFLYSISGKLIPNYIEKACISGMNIFYTALSGVLLYLLFCLLGKSKKMAFLYANCILFCSEMLQYSSTGWSEPASFTWGLFGFVILLIGKNSNTISYSRAWVLWALCALMASLIRMEYIVFFYSYILLDRLFEKRDWKQYVLPFLILSASMGFHGWFNDHRFGSPFNFGYFGHSSGSETPLLSSAYASFNSLMERLLSVHHIQTLYWTYLSFGRIHWFWVCPVLALTPYAILTKKSPLFIDIMFINALFFQLVIIVMGGNSWCWANRYLYTTFVYLLLPVFFVPKKNVFYQRILWGFCCIGFVLACVSTGINYHYVLEVLVQRYGYAGALWEYTMHPAGAPIWLHMAMIPDQFLKTAQLLLLPTQITPWEQLRMTCFDIWPVGMCGFGFNSFAAFGLWIGSIGLCVFYFLFAVKPTCMDNHSSKRKGGSE